VEKSDLAREANERIAQAAERNHFVSRMPLFCECGDPDCRELVLVSRERFEAIRREANLYLTAPGHQLESAERTSASADYWLLRRS
jgi:hypothetical protein